MVGQEGHSTLAGCERALRGVRDQRREPVRRSTRDSRNPEVSATPCAVRTETARPAGPGARDWRGRRRDAWCDGASGGCEDPTADPGQRARSEPQPPVRQHRSCATAAEVLAVTQVEVAVQKSQAELYGGRRKIKKPKRAVVRTVTIPRSSLGSTNFKKQARDLGLVD